MTRAKKAPVQTLLGGAATTELRLANLETAVRILRAELARMKRINCGCCPGGSVQPRKR